MKKISTILILLAVPLILYCDLSHYFEFSEPIDKGELYGYYIANYKDVIDFIELRKDTTYIHYALYPDGGARRDSSYWKFMSNSFNIVPYNSGKLDNRENRTYIGGCNDNRLTLYGFRQTPYAIPGSEPPSMVPETMTKSNWSSCLIKEEGEIRIKIGVVSSLYYVKIDSAIHIGNVKEKKTSDFLD